MQFTTGLVSLLLAAVTTGVRASPVEQRQEAPRIYAKFWADTSCGADGGAWIEDTVWLQEAQPLGDCIDVSIWDPTFNSTSVEFNNAGQMLRVYSQNGCQETGANARFFDVRAEELNCWAQHVESVKFLA
ncbi:hypothetical protein KVR01_011894 [Diaporthe batatas]|uniref:uncharacterized protein n=1 Tax=Diaporthe batatas TaxID=748121 RepID=UPI001D03E7BB|nr:uncharacterized protein KVR01_011894 [Diaporthe batatas]KAG8158133.1 hypothetical protein KVR01_011894 [Diaporthe batatas]